MELDEQEMELLVARLRELAQQGASLMALVDLVHEHYGIPKYSRGAVMVPFAKAFGLGPRDFTGIVFACEAFGDGATVSVEKSDNMFRQRLEQIRRSKED